MYTRNIQMHMHIIINNNNNHVHGYMQTDEQLHVYHNIIAGNTGCRGNLAMHLLAELKILVVDPTKVKVHVLSTSARTYLVDPSTLQIHSPSLHQHRHLRQRGGRFNERYMYVSTCTNSAEHSYKYTHMYMQNYTLAFSDANLSVVAVGVV